jgi:hypothetical protein
VSWDVYKGERGIGPGGVVNHASVISYVNPANDNSRAQTFKDVDILPFIKTATQKYGLSSTAYLTDVFAGFEIWDGGASSNLSVDEFKCVVNK